MNQTPLLIAIALTISLVQLGCSPGQDTASQRSERSKNESDSRPSDDSGAGFGDESTEPGPFDESNQREVPIPAEPDATTADEWVPDVATTPSPERSTPSTAPHSPDAPRKQLDTRKNGITTIRVFYGTDRKSTGSRKPSNFYGAERSGLSVGFCDVSIPPNHKTGHLEAPSIWRFEFSENPAKHVVLRKVQPVDGSTFINGLRQSVEASIVQNADQTFGGEAFVFVHGFNVTFTDAARRTAQMAHDLQFPGAPVMFSWPSLGESNLGSYRKDERTAEWCEEHVMDFVTVIARQSGARRVHLIAHSMGNRILAGVLRRLAYDRRGRDTTPQFNEVILTAPDIDAETFRLAIAPRINPIANRITVYTSSNDMALKASEWVHATGSRLGQGGRKLIAFANFPKIDVVDASSVDTSLFAVNHSYFGESPTVLSDISNVLVGAKADRRGLTTLIPRTAWQIPEQLKRISRATFRLAKQQ